MRAPKNAINPKAVKQKNIYLFQDDFEGAWMVITEAHSTKEAREQLAQSIVEEDRKAVKKGDIPASDAHTIQQARCVVLNKWKLTAVCKKPLSKPQWLYI